MVGRDFVQAWQCLRKRQIRQRRPAGPRQGHAVNEPGTDLDRR
jgi:hypothetical protein